MNENKNQSNYIDEFFESGNLGLKIKQTFMADFGWLGVLLPITVVVIASTHRYLRIFGIGLRLNSLVSFEIFLLIILAFAFVIIGGFSLSMAIIQHERSKHYLNNWPNFDPIKREVVINKMEDFATEKYGDQQYRQSVRSLVIPKEQNIENGTLINLVKAIDEEGKEE
ncbi:hypothetical protein [Lentilactobacillus sp. SPB1-3]|uniref:Uncharacterized protein n=1 Tax=Lentilactobacillus terminaliae TaxID=3003483 RepID=A0ACD5DDR0_9LACO|nr:hypothetical protein [Lentilactobacillus sp. SPB1-3]MCZ0977770.1 hypothetical protein [Lentilactobacillus sp. SPB1-3]